MEDKNDTDKVGDYYPNILTEIKEPIIPRNDEITGSD